METVDTFLALSSEELNLYMKNVNRVMKSEDNKAYCRYCKLFPDPYVEKHNACEFEFLENDYTCDKYDLLDVSDYVITGCPLKKCSFSETEMTL